MDKELSDEEFVGRLERVGILKAVAIFRNLEGFRDAKGLRHLVHRWCSFLHTFFFSVGELTITLEDVVNNFLLPVFGDENPFDIILSEEDLEVENKLFSHFGGRTVSPGGKPAKMGRWVMTLSREKDKEVRRVGFLAFWLSKFLFSEFPGYKVKSTFFPLAIKLAQGAQYPLTPLFLGHVYFQLDQLHGDEAKGDSCYVITSSLHCAILQIFMWDRSSATLAKCRNLKFVKDKFQGSLDRIKGLCGNSTDTFPIIFRWISLKCGGLNLVELFDQAGHLHWRSPREFGLGFACDSVLSSFLTSTRNTFDLRRGDEGNLAYLACISPSWLPVPSLSGLRYTHYLAHWVLRQFGFDQDIPPVFKDIVPSLPFLDPFLRLQAFSYWS